MEHIGKQLDININKSGLRKIAGSARVCYVFEKIRKDLLKDIDCNVISFDRSTLRLKAGSNADASEIRFRSEKIKRELERELKDNVVQRIDVTI